MTTRLQFTHPIRHILQAYWLFRNYGWNQHCFNINNAMAGISTECLKVIACFMSRDNKNDLMPVRTINLNYQVSTLNKRTSHIIQAMFENYLSMGYPHEVDACVSVRGYLHQYKSLMIYDSIMRFQYLYWANCCTGVNKIRISYIHIYFRYCWSEYSYIFPVKGDISNMTLNCAIYLFSFLVPPPSNSTGSGGPPIVSHGRNKVLIQAGTLLITSNKNTATMVKASYLSRTKRTIFGFDSIKWS